MVCINSVCALTLNLQQRNDEICFAKDAVNIIHYPLHRCFHQLLLFSLSCLSKQETVGNLPGISRWSYVFLLETITTAGSTFYILATGVASPKTFPVSERPSSWSS